MRPSCSQLDFRFRCGLQMGGGVWDKSPERLVEVGDRQSVWKQPNSNSRTATTGRRRATAGFPFRVVPTGVGCHSIRDSYRLQKLIGLFATGDDRPDQSAGLSYTDWVSKCPRRLHRSAAISERPDSLRTANRDVATTGLTARRAPVGDDSHQRRLQAGVVSGDSPRQHSV